MSLTDPAPAPEMKGTRAADLKNLPIILRPHKLEQTIGKDDEPWEYFPCDVWILDRSGVVDTATGVRVSWMRVMPQLAPLVGKFVACRPVEEGRSIILAPLGGEARDVAEKVIAELEAAQIVPEQDAPAELASSLQSYDNETF